MDLSFLQDVKLEAVKNVATKSKATVVKLPEHADLRLFPNGRVYPSKEFAEAYKLEFMPKEILEGQTEPTAVVGNGLEIFSSKDWGMIQGKLPEGVEIIFCAPIPKALPKVDMWASTKYDEKNSPKASVFTQGANTFAKTRLVPMIASAYGIDWDTTEYVDLKVDTTQIIGEPSGLYHLPKIVSTGPHKGKADYIRRENLTICPLIVADVKATAPTKAEETESAPDINPSTDMFQDSTENADTPEDKDWAEGLGATTASN